MTRTIPFSILIAAIASIAVAAPSSPSPVAAEQVKRAFGNTIVSTYPDGRKGYLWLAADGTFKTIGRHRTASTGTWSIKRDQVCLKRVHPPAPFAYCTAAPSGDHWPAKAVTGEKIQVALVKGVVDH